MSGKSLEELIDGEVEGTNTPLESARLRDLGERDRGVGARLATHRRAVEALAGAAREEPPGLASAVMERVRAEHQLPRASSVLASDTSQVNGVSAGRNDWRGGWSMATSRKVLLGIAAAAVIAVGYFAVNGFPPVGPGAEGTVGAAKRYQSEQMAGKDVAVQDDGVQALLQSDAFRRVVADKQTRAILASKEFQKAVSDASVQAVVHRLATDKAFADSLKAAASDASFQKLLADAARNGAADAARSSAADAARSSAADAARNSAADAARNSAADAARSNAADAARSSAADAARSSAADAARNSAADAARSNLIAQAAQNPAFAELSRSEAFQGALRSQAFLGLLADKGFVALVSDPGAASLLSSASFQQALANGALDKALDAAAAGATGNGATGNEAAGGR